MKNYFRVQDVMDLLDLTRRKILYWDKIGLAPATLHTKSGRVYSVQDLFFVYLVTVLRDRISVQKMKPVIAQVADLIQKSSKPMSDLVLLIGEENIFVFDGEVYFNEESKGEFLVVSVKDFLECVATKLEKTA